MKDAVNGARLSELSRPGWRKLLAYLTLLTFGIGANIAIQVSRIRNPSPGSSRMFHAILIVGWVLVFLRVGYSILSVPLKIYQRNTSFEFRGFFKRALVDGREIYEIRSVAWGFYIEVRREGGTTRLINPMDGIHAFASAVRAINPRVQISL
jgi:hypothetical protein